MIKADIIAHLNLEPLPEEGGYFRRTYESSEKLASGILPRPYPQDLHVGTAIYALFTPTDFSAMHRLDSDEVYHFYYGDPLEMLLLNPDGSGELFTLGADLAAGMLPQKVIEAGVWQGSRSAPGREHGFTLIGTTMAPGFEYECFELGERDALVAQYPQFTEMISQLVR